MLTGAEIIRLVLGVLLEFLEQRFPVVLEDLWENVKLIVVVVGEVPLVRFLQLLILRINHLLNLDSLLPLLLIFGVRRGILNSRKRIQDVILILATVGPARVLQVSLVVHQLVRRDGIQHAVVEVICRSLVLNGL